MFNRRGAIGCAICALWGARAGPAPAAPRRGGIVDVHAHLQPADYLAQGAAAGLRGPSVGGRPPLGPRPPSPAGDDEAALALRLRLMAAAGVRLQLLSPTLAPYLDAPDDSVRICRLLNDRYAAITRASAGRLAAYVSLPLPHVDQALAEMRRGLDELGMVGVTMQTSALGRSIADDRFEPLFAEMNARKALLFLHPAVGGLGSPLIRDWGLTGVAGPLFEDATVAMHLMVKSIPVRYPDLRIIVPHLGGGLATMLERLDNQMPQLIGGLMARPSEMARRMWFDTVSHGSATSLRAAASAFGAERLVTGSDFPVLLDFEPYAEAFGYVARAGLPKAQADRILYANARDLLGRT